MKGLAKLSYAKGLAQCLVLRAQYIASVIMNYYANSAYHGQALFKDFTYNPHISVLQMRKLESEDHAVVNGGYSDLGRQAPESGSHPLCDNDADLHGCCPWQA